jgi:acetyltransferase
MRFLGPMKRFGHDMAARLSQIDYDREMAFVALAGEPGSAEILGEVRVVSYPDGDSGEFAILVRSDVKRRGIGRALMEKVIDHARSRGKHSLIGQIDRANEAMIALARRSGMEVEIAPESNFAIAHLDLRPARPDVRLF